MKIQFGSFREQSTRRKILNIVGLLITSVIILELLLRGLGFLFSLKILRVENLLQGAEDSEYTILCIGDSWTGGQPSGNYPDYLQEALNSSDSDRQYRVINLAIGGGNSSQALRQLIKNLPKYQPDMAIVLTGSSDHWNLSESAYWKFADEDMNMINILRAKTRIFFHSLRVYKLCKILYYKIVGLPPIPNQFYYLNPEDDRPATLSETSTIDLEVHRKQLEYNLIRFVELAQASDFTLIFQTYFHFHGYRVNEIIRNIAMTYHIPLADNNVLFHQKIAVEERDEYLIPDGHPSDTGYKFIAENILDVLRKEGLILRDEAKQQK